MRRSGVKVALLFLLAAGLVVWILGVLPGGSPFKSRGYELTAVVTDATCLPENTRVQISGIPVGHVVARRIVPGGAELTIHIDRRDTVVWEDAVLTKRTGSFFGECVLDLDPGHPYRIENGVRVPNRRLGVHEAVPPAS